MIHLAMTLGLATAGSAAPPTVLFLCTGNFYRSRLAEAVFNHEAAAAGSPWRAVSRAIRRGPLKPDQQAQKLSPFTREKLTELGIALTHTSAEPIKATPADLAAARCVIAMSEDEHRPLVESQFGVDPARPVAYWRHDDKELRPPREVMPEVIADTRHLLDELRAGRLPPGCRGPTAKNK